MTAPEKRQLRYLTQRLAELDGTIHALLSGQIDAMVDARSATTLLLAKSQAILRESEERLRLERDRAQFYLDTAEVILLALDLRGRITLVNRYACSILGWTPEELLGRNWIEMCLPSRVRATIRTSFRNLHGGDAAAGQYLIRAKSGAERLIEWRSTLTRDDNGRVLGTLSSGSDITERDRATAEHLRLEQRLSLATAVAKVGVWEWDLADNALNWDLTMFEIYGFEATASLPYAQWAAVVHRADLPERLAALQKVVAEKGRGTSEFRVFLKDGSIRHISTAERAVLDKRGNVSSVVGVNVDVTASKQAEAALRAAKEDAEAAAIVLAEQAALLDLATDAIFVRDINDQITFWNRGAARLYGWISEQALGKVSHELLQTRFPIPLAEINTRLSSEGRWEGELVHTCANGSHITVASRWALQHNVSGDPRGVLEINSNITARKQAEEALRLIDEQFRVLVLGVKDYAILMLDPQGRITTWNDGAERIKGYRADEIIGHHLSTFYPPEARALGQPGRGLKTAAETGRFEEQGIRVRKDGTRFMANIVISALRDAAGNLAGFAKVTRDVTAQIDAEKARALSLTNQLRFKGEFLSHVSHELRSPLTAIKQFTSILLSGLGGELSSEQLEFMQIILRNALQLQSMIDDLLEVTRLESGKLSVEPQSALVFDIVADVLDTVQGTASAKGVTISCDMPPGLPPIYVDPTRLRQIFIILIDNAVKFTGNGGSITLRGRLTGDDTDALLLTVSDSGCGIAPEHIDRIFERLYQEADQSTHSSRKGLGLGLFICKELVTRQGGRIWVTSRLQEGSAFSFTVPLVSIDNAIAPLLRNDGWPASSAALVMVEMCSPGSGTSGESYQEWSRETRRVIENCLQSDLDLLLPRLDSPVQTERFIVLVFRQEMEAAAIVNRIRREFEARQFLEQKELSICHAMLQPFTQSAGPSRKAVNTMTGNIKMLIDLLTLPTPASGVYRS